jgi:hypothetical protein
MYTPNQTSQFGVDKKYKFGQSGCMTHGQSRIMLLLYGPGSLVRYSWKTRQWLKSCRFGNRQWGINRLCMKWRIKCIVLGTVSRRRWKTEWRRWRVKVIITARYEDLTNLMRENEVFLGCYAASHGKQSPVLQSSKVSSPLVSVYMVRHPRTTEFSSTPLWVPKISHIRLCLRSPYTQNMTVDRLSIFSYVCCRFSRRTAPWSWLVSQFDK